MSRYRLPPGPCVHRRLANGDTGEAASAQAEADFSSA